MEPKTVDVDGRAWEVGEDGTLRDRRSSPHDGPRLDRGERTYLQLMRICAGIQEVGLIHNRLIAEGLMNGFGELTPEGKLLADILLVDPE